jgi:hypothetical protein
MNNSQSFEPSVPLTEKQHEELQKRYILPTRNRFIALLGGAVAFLSVSGVMSWEVARKSAERVIDTEAGKASLARIRDLAVQAEKDAARLAEFRRLAEKAQTESDRRLKQTIADEILRAKLNDQRISIKKEIEKDSAKQQTTARLKKRLKLINLLADLNERLQKLGATRPS